MRDPWARGVVARFDGEDELRCDAQALGWHAAALAAYAGLCVGLVAPALFMVIGVCAYVRNFNALHEASHARRGRNPLRRLRRLVMIVHGPLQVGHAELAQAHRLHHAFTGDAERDPHVAVHCGTWWAAALRACLAPELALFGHVARARAVGPALARGLAYNAAMTAALVGLGGSAFWWWLAMTRVGSTAVWFIFDWLLHRPGVYARTPAFAPGRALSLVWRVLFSSDNLNATRYHALHHRFAFVADRELPALARYLAGGAGEPVSCGRSPGST
jgi:fatty acid desaturase